MGKLIKIKLIITGLIATLLLAFVIIVVIAVCGGYEAGQIIADQQVNVERGNSTIINSQLYANKYINLVNKYMTTKGYVTLERMVFYLQRTNNVLDTSLLSDEIWENAYLANVNEDEKQMIPIKTVCKNIKFNEQLPEFTIESGTNDNGLFIDVIDLCTVNGVDITISSKANENYLPLPYILPLKKNFTITSFVFENRDVDLGLSPEEQADVDFHSGWDLAVPIGTDFYSICDGKIENIVNTQNNDLPFSQSGNQTGNYITVACTGGNVVGYYHIKYRSSPYKFKKGTFVKKGDFLGKTSTTGRSTGPHLHLEFRSPTGVLKDVMAYINFEDYKGN